MRHLIEIEVKVKADMNLIWECWTEPRHIMNWYHSMDSWHTPSAENDLAENGTFSYRMEAKDGSMGFDFAGRNIKIVKHELIRYLLNDGRRVDVKFKEKNGNVDITEDFEAESKNTIEIEKIGWQNILNNFKIYVENL